MSKKIIELDELKKIMAVQKEHKERNEVITAARWNSVDDINRVLPIGYQPFTRCYKQRSYFIDTMQSGDLVNYDLVADHGF